MFLLLWWALKDSSWMIMWLIGNLVWKIYQEEGLSWHIVDLIIDLFDYWYMIYLKFHDRKVWNL